MSIPARSCRARGSAIRSTHRLPAHRAVRAPSKAGTARGCVRLRSNIPAVPRPSRRCSPAVRGPVRCVVCAAAINVALPRRRSLPSLSLIQLDLLIWSFLCEAGGGCPFHAASASALPASGTFATAAVPTARRKDVVTRQPEQPLSPFAGSPMASLSLSFGLPVGVITVATRVMPPMCLQECHYQTVH